MTTVNSIDKHDGMAHPHSEAEHGEADAVAETGRGQEPCSGRRSGLAADVVHYKLSRLSLALNSPRPLRPALLPKCPVENHDQLQAPLIQAGLGQGSQVAQHGVPLAAANPVCLITTIQTLQAGVRVDEDPGGRRRGRHGPGVMWVVVWVMVVRGLAGRCSGKFQEIHGDSGPRTALL